MQVLKTKEIIFIDYWLDSDNNFLDIDIIEMIYNEILIHTYGGIVFKHIEI